MNVSQLTLSLNLRDEAVLNNFYPGKQNRQVLKLLNAMAHGRGERFIYLWGQQGVGKTHLLHACCHTSNRIKLSNFYLSFKKLDQLQPAVLEGLEKLCLVCVDDIECIAGKKEWEEAFFGFLNRMKDEKKRLIVSTNAAPNYTTIQLPDIKSRLSQAIVFQIHGLTEIEKTNALQLRAKARGLELTDEVMQFLLRRCPRDMGALFPALEKLDQASLEAQHKITIPFVKLVLKL